jgi:ferric-dicitrate binding protein FerR (iron transport regulator)
MALSHVQCERESVTMAEESTQRHTGESTKPPAAHHRASSQHGTPPKKTQPRRNAWSSRRATRTLANVLCLLVGVWYAWTTHDLLGFILLYAIATGAINAREVVGKMLPEHRKGDASGSTHSDDGESE